MSDSTKVEIGQIRQAVKGPIETGSIPYRVMSRDWIFTDYWIVQSLVGQLSRVEESEILKHSIYLEPQ
jgi:hypothetical protein